MEGDRNTPFQSKHHKTPTFSSPKFQDVTNTKLTNKRALSLNALTYELEKFKKNLLIIFNHDEFEKNSCDKRVGTEKDVETLTKSFKKFGFTVTEHKNLTKDAIITTLETITDCKNDLSDYGCVAVAVLTHGSDSGLLRAKDDLYSENKIINHFKYCGNQTLATKPKVIIIQACRGESFVSGTNTNSPGSTSKDIAEKLDSDMLILHSCYAGSPSYRNDLHGSWFIQELCKSINLRASTHDLEAIMTDVKWEVAINKHIEEYDEGTSQTNINKQMPVITSTLIRKLYLRKFGEIALTMDNVIDSASVNPFESRNEQLDGSVMTMPISIQVEPGSTFMDLYFNFMKTCLKSFIEDNPDNEIAKDYWDLADTYKDTKEFIASKEKLSKVISKYLISNTKKFKCNKIVRLYKE